MDSLIENLRRTVGREQLLTEPDELLVYECDGLTHYRARPRAVVFPHSTEEVSAVVRMLGREGVSFAPRGAGTGLSGGALALGDGVVIELARMRRLLKIDAGNRLAVVETGLINAQLSRAVAPFNLHYVPDPSSQATCTIGGNIAENAGGIHCLKYGTTVDHVLSTRVVLADGEIVDLTCGDEGASGYDLLGLFVGSEGTFGIATEATVRLTPIAPAVRTLLADFADVDDASRAVSAIIAGGLLPAALEMVDGATIRAVEASVFAAGLPLDAEAALLVELDGLDAGLDDEAQRVEDICMRHGARLCRRAADERERKKFWAARKGAFGAMGRISPDLMLQDAVVPRSRLPEVLADIYRIGAKYKLRIANVFHAGDGNLHPFICFDGRDRDEVARVHEAGREIMETCVGAGGTITGEHGVGLDKSAYLPLVFSDADLDAMLRVRAAFDPAGLCNPGKIIPAPQGCGEARAAAKKTEARHADATSRRGDAEMQRRLNGATAATDNVEDANVEATATVRATAVAPRLHVGVSPRFVAARSASHQKPLNLERSSNALVAIVGAENVSVTSAGETREAIEVTPANAAEVSEILRLAASEAWSVVPAGAGVWLDAGQALRRPVNLIVKTTRMSRLVEHEPADLVATVEAGMTLRSLNQTLAHAGQWLALDPPDDGRATLGGIAATGLAGAQSLSYGAPRSMVLGMRVALAGGEIIKAGGRVVKNVAGYDMCKLFVGSYGTLGMILETTFRLRPLPSHQATVVVRGTDFAALLDGGRAIIGTQFRPVAFELVSPRLAQALNLSGDADAHALLIRFAGNESAVRHQQSQAEALLGKIDGVSSAASHADDSRLWSDFAAATLPSGDGLAWRATSRPSELGALLLSTLKRNTFNETEALWHASVGIGRLRVHERVTAETEQVASALEKLRRTAHASGGSLVVEHAPVELKRAFNPCDVRAAPARLMHRIKEQLDPQDSFSPGRF
ncbi:MAG TPA: FAD-linked oxidase C-terminal domain-containing protein [Pyrinomonadaceae bacterium]